MHTNLCAMMCCRGAIYCAHFTQCGTCEICTKPLAAFLAFAAFLAHYQSTIRAIKESQDSQNPCANLMNLTNFANLSRIFWKPITDKPIPTKTTSPLNQVSFATKALRRNGNRRKRSCSPVWNEEGEWLTELAAVVSREGVR